MSSSSDIGSDEFVDIASETNSNSSDELHLIHALQAQLAAVRMRSAVDQVQLALVTNRLEYFGSLLGLPNSGLAVRSAVRIQAGARRRRAVRCLRRAQLAVDTVQRCFQARGREHARHSIRCREVQAATTIQRWLRGFFARFVHNPRCTVSSLLRALMAQRRRSACLAEKSRLALQLLGETQAHALAARARDAKRAVSEDFTYSIYDARYLA